MHVELRPGGVRPSAVVSPAFDLSTIIVCYIVDDKSTRDVVKDFITGGHCPAAHYHPMTATILLQLPDRVLVEFYVYSHRTASLPFLNLQKINVNQTR